MKDIIVFGTGKYFETKREIIERNYNITVFLDNKVKSGEMVVYQDTGVEVINPVDLNDNETTEIFLMSVHFVSMWKQLCRIGVKPERLIFPYMEQPFFENEDALCSYVEKIVFSERYFECFRTNGTVVRITDDKDWRAFLRQAYKQKYPLINAIASMTSEPISRQFGTERGMPIDRFYIERFLENNKQFIKGDVLEIEDSMYTKQFGGEHVKTAIVMDVSSVGGNVTFQGNLETGVGIMDEIVDCFILTQTLMYIFDLKSAARNIGRLLKKGGKVLITCSGISQNSIRCMDDYGCYFNFNQEALLRIFEDETALCVIKKGSYGNVKTVTAHLNGLCCEDLKEDDFEVNDKYYPLIVYAVVEKQ